MHLPTQFYSNVLGQPILAMTDKFGTVYFINLRTKETFAQYEFELTIAKHFLHHVRNGSDYVLLYFFNNGGVLHVYRDGRFLFKNEDAAYTRNDISFGNTYLAICNDYIIVILNILHSPY
jgi:hypothetical protein